MLVAVSRHASPDASSTLAISTKKSDRSASVVFLLRTAPRRAPPRGRDGAPAAPSLELRPPDPLRGTRLRGPQVAPRRRPAGRSVPRVAGFWGFFARPAGAALSAAWPRVGNGSLPQGALRAFR